MRLLQAISVVLFLVLLNEADGKLTICGKKICHGRSTLYLSGVNQAWENYARDFGNNKYSSAKSKLEKVLSDVHAYGGNSIRIWLHTDSMNTPRFSSSGYVASADSSRNHIITEMRQYLDAAQKKDVVVFFVLWNLATWNTRYSPKLGGLITSDIKLRTYLDNALIPIVSGLRGHKALGGYEIVNEPEGSVGHFFDWNSCYNTYRLRHTGAGWTKQTFTMKRILRFVNWQADAIKRTDPDALVTVGSWSEKGQSRLTSDSYNYFSDHCLKSAGGRSKGTLDFYQMHTYASNNKYNSKSPMNIKASTYRLDKPIVIGEFSQSGSDGRTITQLIKHAYDDGYAGTWSWHAKASGKHSDSFLVQKLGLLSIRKKPGINLNL